MSLARNVAAVGGATMVSRALGFVRDVLIAAVFGAGPRADAFFVAFQLVNLIRRMLGEGALNSSVVPVYLRAREQSGDAAAGAFAGQLIGTFAVGLVALATISGVIMPAIILILAPGFVGGDPRMGISVELARLMLPYMLLAGPVAVLMGVLNANYRFTAAAFAPVVFNLAMLTALALIFLLQTGDSEASSAILAIGVTLAGIAQFVLVYLAVKSGGAPVGPLSVSFGRRMRKFIAFAIPGLLASGLPQITIIAGTMVASTSPSAVSWLYYANRLIELPLGIVSIAIGTVLVPAFTHAVRSGDKREMAIVESRGLELALGLALPAAIALAMLAEPIVHTLFQRGAFRAADTAATSAALIAFAFGIPGFVLVKAFSPVFFAREDTLTPMRAALIAFVVAVFGSLFLMPIFGHVGVAVSIAFSGWVNAALLAFLIHKRVGFSVDHDARQRLPRIAGAAVAMGVVVKVLQLAVGLFIPADSGTLVYGAELLILVVLGFAIYVALLQILSVVSLREIAYVARRRL